jgi:hypothetical protein
VHAVLALGGVRLRAEVDHHRVVVQGHEGVTEALGDIEAAPVLGVEPYGLVLAVGGRAHAEVDDHVQDRAAHARHVLGLARRNVRVVDAAQGSLGRHRAVGLAQVEGMPGRRQIVAPEPLVERAAMIAVDLRGDGKSSFDAEWLHMRDNLMIRRSNPDTGMAIEVRSWSCTRLVM